MTTVQSTPALQRRYIGMAIDQFRVTGALSSMLLKTCHLDRYSLDSEANYVDLKSLEFMVNTLIEQFGLSAEKIGLEFGSRINFNAHGSVGLAALSSDTLGEAVDIMCRYFHTASPLYRLTKEINNGLYSVTIYENTPLSSTIQIVMTYALLATFFGMIKVLLNGEVDDYFQQLHVTIPLPESDRIDLPKDWPVIHYNSPTFFICAKEKYAHCRSPLANPYICAQAIKQCQSIAEQLLRNNFSLRVKARIRDNLTRSARLPSAEQLAQEFSISARTLHRLLAKEHVNFRDIVTDTRLERAKKLLRSSGDSITNIAHHVGYADSANFTRAFKRQFGATPRHWRAQNAPYADS